MPKPNKTPFKQYRVEVMPTAKRHTGQAGVVIAETPHGPLVRFDARPAHPEVHTEVRRIKSRGDV